MATFGVWDTKTIGKSLNDRPVLKWDWETAAPSAVATAVAKATSWGGNVDWWCSVANATCPGVTDAAFHVKSVTTSTKPDGGRVYGVKPPSAATCSRSVQIFEVNPPQTSVTFVAGCAADAARLMSSAGMKSHRIVVSHLRPGARKSEITLRLPSAGRNRRLPC